MLLHRGWTAKIRDLGDLKAQFFKALAFGVVAGIVFFGKGDISPPFLDEQGARLGNVSSCASLLFLSMLFNMMNNLQAIASICEMNKIYRRELKAFAYCASPYWVAGLLTQIPIMLVCNLAGMSVLYGICKFPASADYYFYFFFVLFFASITSLYFAQFLAAATGSATLAFAIFPVTFLFLSMFSGYGIPITDVPKMWEWAPYISYARWTFQGLMVNEFEQFGADGEEILREYGFEDYDKGNTIWILLVTPNLFQLAQILI